ncbi:hypothetical protein LTR36_001600 [Oleoguttula mirabilis]|uniref:Uncharacterized protein n=1 Tax=Oleoguttula mirabilis TaxID=1507867 RepID=A0AAV9JQP6_9PEZI|nr:hypothetical protein LTR36_001600 [Oleoguttula mirabilis]
MACDPIARLYAITPPDPIVPPLSLSYLPNLLGEHRLPLALGTNLTGAATIDRLDRDEDEPSEDEGFPDDESDSDASSMKDADDTRK